MSPPAQIRREGMLGNSKIRCVLVHDHVLLRQGLRRLLEDEPDIEVVAEAGNAAESMRRISEHRPDVVIADPAVFEMRADEVQVLVSQGSAHAQVLFLDEAKEGKAHESAVNSFAARRTSAQELLHSLRKLYSAKNSEIREFPRKGRGEWSAESASARKRSLTTREKEVLKLLAEGQTVRSAAAALGLSVKTVDAHKFNLMRKLGIHNKAELVMWAIQKRVVKIPSNF